MIILYVYFLLRARAVFLSRFRSNDRLRRTLHAQLLLDKVLISPDGSNDRSAYVYVVDLNNSRCFMSLSFLSLHPYNRQAITQGQYHFLQSLIRCHFVVKLPQRHGLPILVVRRVDDMPVP